MFLQIVMLHGGSLIYGETEEIIKTSDYDSTVKRAPSKQYRVQDVFFILRKSDLPIIKFDEPIEQSKTQLRLAQLSQTPPIYPSFVDINRPENSDLKEHWNVTGANELKVQLAIEFSCALFFKNGSDIIQVDVASQFSEHGIQNSIDEILPIK